MIEEHFLSSTGFVIFRCLALFSIGLRDFFTIFFGKAVFLIITFAALFGVSFDSSKGTNGFFGGDSLFLAD